MYCIDCDQHVSRCTCPDIDERLAALNAPETFVALKVCKKCDKHYARCQCPEPEFVVRTRGKEYPPESFGL